MSHYCSVFSLCIAAIACLVSVAFVGIAFSTDNWVHISVNRQKLLQYADQNGDIEDIKQLKRNLKSNALYFDRVKGIFRVCFPYADKPKPSWDKKPEDKGHHEQLVLYLNPIEEWCTNINYYLDTFEMGIVPPYLTYDGSIWLHLSRCCIISFAFFFMFTGIACVTGLVGCWRASGDYLISTALLMLVATLWGGAGMGFWHGAQFYEMNRVFDVRLEFYLTWPTLLRENTSFHIGWSYIVAWIGIAVSLVSCIMFSFAAICIKHQFREIEKEEETFHKMQYMMPQHHGWPAHAVPYGPPRSPPPPFSVQPAAYYSVGYPQHDDNVSDPRIVGKYKNVVKELEDAKC